MAIFWPILRILGTLASASFIAVGLAFFAMPHFFTGEPIAGGSALWHSLTIAFMSTVTALALLVALNPRIHWPMLLPLAVGKLTSSATSLYWYATLSGSPAFMLLVNSAIDGSIGVLSLLLYLAASRANKG